MLLKVQNLKKYFPVYGGFWGRVVGQLKAVDGISFELSKGQTLGLVGESGCGKSTLGRTILKLYEPNEGEIFFEGEDLAQISRKELRHKRKDIQIIFQDPYSSLNPRMTIREIISEPFLIHKICKAEELNKKILSLIDTVGLESGALSKYPHEFSGGQRQRIGIARALALSPKLIIADEPVSALDVSIQSQILNLLMQLKEEFELSYLFISHDLAVVEHISDMIAVMYLGKIVELTSSEQLIGHALHPYSQALIAAVPHSDLLSTKINKNQNSDLLQKQEQKFISGDVPSPTNPPSGCAFHPRCFFATEKCRKESPKLVNKSKNGVTQMVACHNV